VEVYNEGKGECKDKGKHREREAESEQIEELNDEGCKRYLGGEGNRPALYSSQMDSLRTILSIHGGLYTSLLFVHMWLR
jgi:hypothetical protein